MALIAAQEAAAAAVPSEEAGAAVLTAPPLGPEVPEGLGQGLVLVGIHGLESCLHLCTS